MFFFDRNCHNGADVEILVMEYILFISKMCIYLEFSESILFLIYLQFCDLTYVHSILIGILMDILVRAILI